MKVLITGANGLLGHELVCQLEKEGNYELIVSGRGPSRFTQLQSITEYIDLDITHAEKVFEVFERVQPEVVIHAAAMTQVDDCEENKQQCYNTNVGATRFLIDASKTTKTWFIYISTDFVFDGKSGPYGEDAVPAPVNYYGSTKLAAEHAVMESGLDWSIIRTVLVFGNSQDGSRSNLITWVQKSLTHGRKIKVVADQWRTPTFVEDLAKGIVLLLKKKAKGIYHISGKDMLSPYEMSLQVAQLLQLDVSLIEQVDGNTFTQCGERPKKTGFVIDKAKKQLGFEPISFNEAINRMFKPQSIKQDSQVV
ncbi:MAG TPA: SDR family oxidoreductase [Flavitalea sp.]|nr:SDR family oxidoreductase [Flavitalea sp.]